MPYPQEIKDVVLSRILEGELTVLGASRQYRISRPTIYSWKKDAILNAAQVPGLTAHNNKALPMTKLNLPQGVTYFDAIRITGLKKYLSEVEFGKLCREKGLVASEVDEWEKWFEEHPNAVDEEELLSVCAKLKESLLDSARKDRVIAKKDKALANAGVMLLLSKKAEAIWGDKASSSAPKTAKK